MAVPTTITDLSVTVASNSPAGADTVTTTTGPDEYFRALSAILRRTQAQATVVASASTVDLGAVTTGDYFHISGTTTITAFGTVAAGIKRVLVFDGALILTHNATSLILPGGANITTVAGDVFEFVSEGSGNWRCTYTTALSRTATTATNQSGGTVNAISAAGLAISVGVDQTLPANGYNISGPSYGGAIELRSNSSTTSRGFRLGLRDSGSGFTPIMTYLSSYGALQISSAISLEAGQITFPSTQNPSADVNTLDDYEEDSTDYAPTTTGISGVSTLTSGANHIKIGKMVTMWVYFAGNPTGFTINANATITLPYVAAAITQYGTLFYSDNTFNRMSLSGATAVINTGHAYFVGGIAHGCFSYLAAD